MKKPRDKFYGSTLKDQKKKFAKRVAKSKAFNKLRKGEHPGRFDVIMADPPWPMQLLSNQGGANRFSGSLSASLPFKTLTIDQIKSLDVKSLSSPGAVLILWIVASMLKEGIEVAEAWGFRVKQTLVWEKTLKDGRPCMNGLGRPFRNNHEIALFCTTPGFLKDNVDVKQSSLCRSQFSFGQRGITKHSQKPYCFHDAIEKIYPDRRCIELFARRERPGWTTVGNECPSTLGEDITDSIKRLQEKQ